MRPHAFLKLEVSRQERSRQRSARRSDTKKDSDNNQRIRLDSGGVSRTVSTKSNDELAATVATKGIRPVKVLGD
jgi:hypothetical protein